MPHKKGPAPPPGRIAADFAQHNADKRLLERMLLFSDAVFAIVLTLLVLDLRPPEGIVESTITVAVVIEVMARNLFSFIISFMLVGLWWFVHMRITKPLQVFDWPTAILNFTFLLTVTLVPFASSLLSLYGRTGAAWQIYWGVNAGSSLTLALVGLVSSRGKGKLIGGTTTATRAIGFFRAISPGLCFVAGIALAANGRVDLARYAWAPIPFLMIIMGRIQRRYAGK
jgi:uncharacterized membrane protein